MKIKPEHFAYLQSQIQPLDTEELRASYRDAGLSDMRYRWDLTYRAKLTTWICDNLYRSEDGYDYLNDTHIDTALRRIVPTL